MVLATSSNFLPVWAIFEQNIGVELISSMEINDFI